MVEIITIDGPASSGKGTVAKLVAKRLGFNYLESGAIYRALGLWVYRNFGMEEARQEQVLALVAKMGLSFKDDRVILNGEDVTDELRDEMVGMLASKYGAMQEVRLQLLEFQRNFAKAPGLVTDGRDMGTVVFPNARLKVFLTASAKKRAERRYKQLQQLDKSVKISCVLQDIITRDEQDFMRSNAPLSYDSSYRILDNSQLDVEGTVAVILNWYNSLRL